MPKDSSYDLIIVHVTTSPTVVIKGWNINCGDMYITYSYNLFWYISEPRVENMYKKRKIKTLTVKHLPAKLGHQSILQEVYYVFQWSHLICLNFLFHDK